MAESALPYPTAHRLRLADAIAANQVKHYHWINPWSCDTARDAAVTARVLELVHHGLAEIPDPPDDLPESMVRLTPEGMAWVTRARTSKISTGEGPGSTSPEPGPATCPDYPDCSEERLVRDMAASVAAWEPVGRWTTGCAACGTLTKGDLE